MSRFWPFVIVLALCSVSLKSVGLAGQPAPAWYVAPAEEGGLVVVIEGLWEGSSVEMRSDDTRLDASKVAYGKGFFNQYLLPYGVYSLNVDGWSGRLPIDASEGSLTFVKFAVAGRDSLRLRLEIYAQDVTEEEAQSVDVIANLGNWGIATSSPRRLKPTSNELRLFIRPPWPIPQPIPPNGDEEKKN